MKQEESIRLNNKEERSQAIYLCYCPGADPVMPHAALPALGGRLKEDGLENYRLRDLNVEAFHYFLAPENVAFAMDRVSLRVKNRTFPTPERQAEAVELLEKASGLAGRIGYVLANCRDAGSFYDIPSFLALREDFDMACKLVSMQYDRVEFGKYSVFPHAYESFEQIRAALEDPETVMIRDFYRDGIIARIKEEKPLVLAITVAYFSQLIPSFILAEETRRVSPGTHIVMGGPVVTWGEEIIRREAGNFATLLDSFCVGEGEETISRLLKTLTRGSSLSDVPNLVYFENGASRKNRSIESDLTRNIVVMPDYKSMPMELYLAPDRIISMTLTKGCYYNKCKFCNYAFIKLSGYQECQPRLAARHIAGIVEQTGERIFSFESDVIGTDYLEAFSQALLEEQVEIKWHGCMRFESGLDQRLFDLMARAGCTRLYIGLESGNQRILDKMEKGIRIEAVEDIFNFCKNAGIFLEIGVFLGYPGETIREARDTMAFIRENRDKIKRVDPGIFRMLKGAPIESEMERDNVTLKKHRDSYWYTMEIVNPGVEANKEEYHGILKDIQAMYPNLAAMDVSDEILFVAHSGYGSVDEVARGYVERTGRARAGADTRYIYY